MLKRGLNFIGDKIKLIKLDRRINLKKNKIENCWDREKQIETSHTTDTQTHTNRSIVLYMWVRRDTFTAYYRYPGRRSKQRDVKHNSDNTKRTEIGEMLPVSTADIIYVPFLSLAQFDAKWLNKCLCERVCLRVASGPRRIRPTNTLCRIWIHICSKKR